MKKFLAIILCAVMFLPAIPITAGAETYNDLRYKKYDDHIEITGCNRNVTSVDIPAEIDGLPVTEIGDVAFCDCRSLTSITIGTGVTSIGINAFGWCKSLTSVIIPDGVTSIGENAFGGCGSLNISVDSDNKNYSDIDGVLFNKNKTEIIAYAKDEIQPEYTIPNCVTSIGNHAFSSCRSLTSVTIPNSVTSIGNRAFMECAGLKSVIIPNGVTSIGNYAFRGCDSLINVTISSNVTSIGECAFDGCSSLMNVTIPDSVTSIGDYAFNGCDNLTSVTIPSRVTSIGEGVFFSCDSLTNVTIPSSVTSIGESAFFSCDSLTSVTIPDSVKSIGDFAFDGCFGLTDVYYGGSEADWQKIDMGDDNDYLTGATIHYNSAGPPQISVAEPVVEGGSITITAETKNIEGVGELFAVGYDGGKLTASEKLQDGAATLPAEDVKTIKVFCWDSLDTMRPLCEPKTITIK